MENQSIHLFTSSFPLSNAPESVFIQPELKYLVQTYETVFIHPNTTIGNATYDFPSNVVVVKHEESFLNKVTFLDYLSIFKILIIELFNNKNLLIKRNFTYLFSLLKKYVQKKNQLKSFFNESKKLHPSDIIYTYWMDEWCTILSLLKNDIKFPNKFITRAHGFDLYDERSKFGKIPFRKLQLKNLDKVYSISASGCEYLINKNPKYKSKIEYSRLGVHDQGISTYNKKELTIVSCSSISPVKRVHLLVEILSRVNKKVNWIHFGDGKLREKLESEVLKLPKNITYNLKGHVSNAEVVNFYKENEISLFINVSESEGIPVSIMEALSFSIPVIAFNVGGISEILNNNTGLLLEPDNVSKIIEVLNDFPTHPIFSDEKRKEVRLFWKQNFDAEKNHRLFIKKIQEIK